MQEQALVSVEAITWPLVRRRVHPHIGDGVEPVPSLLIEVGIIGKRPAVSMVSSSTTSSSDFD
jgi:hypothetical protein